MLVIGLQALSLVESQTRMSTLGQKKPFAPAEYLPAGQGGWGWASLGMAVAGPRRGHMPRSCWMDQSSKWVSGPSRASSHDFGSGTISKPSFLQPQRHSS